MIRGSPPRTFGKGLGNKAMKSSIVKRSIVLAGHKTSVSLEDAFWRGLKDIATSRRATLSDLVSSIATERQYGNLSSAIRLFVLNHFQGGTASPNRSFVASDQHHAAH
jgi:predicted DNA-binding ribbon-helix-helix protein